MTRWWMVAVGTWKKSSEDNLGLIAAGDAATGAALADALYRSADNMTDRQGSLMVLANLDVPEREAALADFYDR